MEDDLWADSRVVDSRKRLRAHHKAMKVNQILTIIGYISVILSATIIVILVVRG